MEVIPSFVTAPEPAPPDEARPHERPYFLFVGRIEHLKGLADVLPLFMSDRGADLVIAGTGAAEAHFKAQTAGSPYVRWLGFVPRHELGPLYRHALASLVPSTTYETFGIVVIEALSHGTPVIVRNRGPLPELAARGGGLVFDTPAELDAALRAVVSDPGLRDRLAGEAERAFREHWSEEAVVPQFVASVDRARRKRVEASAAAAVAGVRPA
jgi:glycosyltransferase involved in cell wall biosynthesis